MKRSYTFTGLLLLSLLCSAYCRAQVKGWDICPNSGLLQPANTRLDDIYFFNKDTGLVVTSYGQILKTTDGGNTWQGKYFAPLTASTYFRSIEFSDNHQYGIAGALDGNVFRTQDRGETWTNINSNVPDTGLYQRLICGLSHRGNNTFYGVGW